MPCIMLAFGMCILFAMNASAEWKFNIPDGNIAKGYWPSIALGSDENPHIAYRKGASGGILRYLRLTGSSWVNETVESGISSQGGGVSLALSEGLPRICYFKDGVGLRFAEKNGALWTIQTIDPTGGQYASLKIDPMGNYHIGYYALNDLKYAKWDGISWTTTTIDTGGVGKWTSLALDSQGHPFISYQDSNKNNLKMANFSGVEWSTQTVDSNNGTGEYTSIAIDSNDYPLISYNRFNTEVWFASWNGTKWTIEQPGPFGGKYTSLALDRVGNPYISFQSWASGTRIFSRHAGKWKTDYVTDAEGEFSSLALGASGKLFVSYGSTYLNLATNDPLTIPTNVAIAMEHPDQIYWQWTDNSSGETGYRILNPLDLTPISPDLPAGSSRWSQKGLTPNTTYQIVVQAFSDVAVRNSELSAVARTHAEPPINTSIVSVAGTTASIAWSANSNPPDTKYLLTKGNIGGGLDTTVLVGTSTSIVVDLIEGSTNYFYVKAENNAGVKTNPDTTVIVFAPATSSPTAPGDPIVTDRTTRKLVWRWVDRSNNEAGFRVIRASDSFVLATLSPNSTSWEQWGLNPNTRSQIQIESFNSGGSSRTARKYDNYREYTLSNPAINPVVSELTATTAQISWSLNGNPEGTLHDCFYSKDYGPYVQFGYFISNTTHKATGLESGAHYTFRIVAISHGFKQASGVYVSTRTPVGPPPSPVYNYRVLQRSSSTITWIWEDVPNEDGYRILRANDGVALSSDLTANTTFWTQAGLSPNEAHSVIIEAFNTFGSSGTNATGTSQPAIPSMIRASSTTPTSVYYVWSPNGNPPNTMFMPEISNDGINFQEFSKYTTASGAWKDSLNDNTTYYFRVRALSSDFLSESPYSETLTTFLQSGPPPNPVVRPFESTISSIKWNWDDTPNELGYQIIRNLDGVSLSGELPAGTTSWTQLGLMPNEKLDVKIVAYNVYGSSGTDRRGYTLANPPSGIRFSTITPSEVQLAWDAQGNSPETYYFVEQSVDSVNFDEVSRYRRDLTAIASSLVSGTTYYFRVRAMNGSNIRSEYGTVISTVVPFGPPAAVIPSVLKRAEKGLWWGWKEEPNADGYRVLTETGDLTLATLPGGTTTWFQPDLELFSRYTIRVESYNVHGSSRSGVAVGYTNSNPVTDLTVTAARPTSVDLAWSTNGNPDSVWYLVQRSTWSFPEPFPYQEERYVEDGKNETTVYGLKAGTTYFFRIRNYGAGDLTWMIVSTVTPTSLSIPVAQSVTAHAIVWNWTREVTDETGYRVLRFSDGKDLSGLLPKGTLSWTQNQLDPNTAQKIIVRAEGPFGSFDSVPSQESYTLPNPPKGLRLVGTGPGKAQFAWDANGNPSETQFVVERSTDGSNFNNGVLVLTPSARIAGLRSRTSYTFIVRALGPSGLSDASLPVTLSLTDPFQFDRGNNEWSVETVDEEGLQGEYSVIALDGEGAPHVFYSSGPGEDLKMAKREGGQWSFDVLVPDANIQSPLAVDVDGTDQFHVAFNNGLSLQSHTVYEKTLLNTVEMPYDSFPSGGLQVSINGQGSRGSSVQVRPNGDQVIVYGLNVPAHMTSSGMGYYLFYEAVRSAQVPLPSMAKGVVALDPSPGDGGWDKSLIAAVSIPRNSNGSSSSGVGEIDVALDAEGQSHVVFFHCEDRDDNPNALGDIVYAHRSAQGDWVTETIESQIATEESSVSIEMDSAQVVHVLYHDNKNVRVRHARKEGAGWTIDTIEEGAFLHAFLKTAVDGLGRLHAVYLDITSITADEEGDESIAGALRYSRFVEGRWEVQTIESGVGIGFHPSIAVDPMGNVHVAYQDQEKQDLKYASLMGQVMEVRQTVQREGGRFSFAGSRGPLVLNVPANAFDQEVTLTIGPPALLAITQTTDNSFVPLGVALEIKPNPALKPTKSILVTIPYNDSDVIGIRESGLILARYDATLGVWVPLSTRVDSIQNNLTASVDELGVFQIMYQTIGVSVSETIAYPNPMRPGRPGHEQMTFDQLPVGASLKIYTIRGGLVRELTEEGNGQAHWDGRNDNGETVASGVYFVRIVGDGGDKILKVAVQR
jgi:hypothetical protein